MTTAAERQQALIDEHNADKAEAIALEQVRAVQTALDLLDVVHRQLTGAMSATSETYAAIENVKAARNALRDKRDREIDERTRTWQRRDWLAQALRLPSGTTEQRRAASTR